MFFALTLFLQSFAFSISQFVPLPAGSLPISTNPGIKVQITRKGLDYFRDFTAESLNHNLRQLNIKEWRVNANTLGLPGDDLAIMRNAEVINYIPPSRTALQPTRPNKLIWVLQGIGMETVGEFELFAAQDRASNLPAIHAQFQAEFTGLNMQISVTMGKSVNGTAQLKVDGCKSEITGPVQVRLTDQDPTVTETLAIMAPIIETEFRRVFGQQICDIGTQFVETELSNLVAEYTSKLSFGEDIKFPNQKEEFLSFIFPWKEINNFVVDSNLVANPIVTQQYVETHLNGRIYHKTDRPEFHSSTIRPNPMPQMPFQSTKMLQIQISEYALNSFMVSAFGHNLLRTEITPTSHPKLKGFLNLRCHPTEECVGAALPELTQKYRGSGTVQMIAKAKAAPVFEFHNEGIVSFALTGSLVMKAKLGTGPRALRENFIAADVAVRCRASLAYVRQRIRGKVRIDGVDLVIRNSLINVDETSKKKLIGLSTVVFEEIINADLANGVPMPLLDAVTLHSSELGVQRGAVLFTTDLALDETTTRNLVAAAIQRHFSPTL